MFNAPSLLTGVAYFLRGFSLIAKPGLKRFVAIPFLINLVIFAGLYFLCRHYVAAFNAWFIDFLPSWLKWLEWLIWFLFAASFLLIFVFLFTVLANVISAPFNALLSEKVERYLRGVSLPSNNWRDSLRDIPRAFKRQFAVIFYYLPRTAFIFILFFIPIAQVFASFIWFLWNAWWMTLTYTDYPADNHRVSFEKMREWLQTERWTAVGFGMSILVFSMMPFINLLVMPAAVAAATLFWVERASSLKKE